MPAIRPAPMLLVLAALGLATALPAHAQNGASSPELTSSPRYTFQTLDAPGAWTTTLLGINNQHQIVGYYSLPSTHYQRYSFFYEARTFTVITDPLAKGDTYVAGINNKGQIYGSYATLSSGGLGSEPTDYGFVDTFGAFTTISWGFHAIWVSGVNDQDQIVGGYGDGGIRDSFGYIDINSTFTDITPPAALNTGWTGTNAFIQGINDQGEVIGYYYDMNAFGHSFLYTKGAYQIISDPLATRGTYASGINNKGQIVGSYNDETGWHGFTDDDSRFTTINFPTAQGFTFANGINDAGQIVGHFELRTPHQYKPYDPTGNGFIATPLLK